MSNSPRRGFICAGCWTVDRIKLIDTWPDQEELARITDVDQLGGGSAHNVGIDLCKLDSSMPVSTIGCVGNDEDGDFLFREAEQYQLDTTQLWRIDERATSYTDVMSVVATGKRTFFHYTGANDLLTPEHFDFTENRERILHLGLLSVHAGMDAPRSPGLEAGDDVDSRAGSPSDDYPDNGWSDVLRRARAQGLLTSIEMVSIDAETNRRLIMPCLPHLDYLVVNDHEIGSVADIVTIENGNTLVDNCLQAARKVLGMGAMTLVAVHFPEGAICITRSGDEFVTRSLTVPQSLVAGSVGAGDAFVAGFLYGMHENWSVEESLSLAHAVAAASLRSTTTVGAVESIERCRQFAQTLSAP